MRFLRPIKLSLKRYGLAHTIGRGIEYTLLQTQPTADLYYRISPAWYKLKYSRQLQQYSCPPDVFATYLLDPSDIVRFSLRKDPSEGALYDVGSVIGGEWDLRKEVPPESVMSDLLYGYHIKETPLYHAMEQHFINNTPWTETQFINEAILRAEKGRYVWDDLQSEKEIIDRCREIDRLFDRIKEEGYKSQKELRDIKPSLGMPFGYLNEQIMEVAVDIDRNGETLLLDGRHRLIISKLLDLEQIPVQVIVRHKQWMKKREKNINGGANLEHIDLPPYDKQEY